MLRGGKIAKAGSSCNGVAVVRQGMSVIKFGDAGAERVHPSSAVGGRLEPESRLRKHLVYQVDKLVQVERFCQHLIRTEHPGHSQVFLGAHPPAAGDYEDFWRIL